MSANLHFIFSGLLLVSIGRGMSEISTEGRKQAANLQHEFNTLKKCISGNGERSLGSKTTVTGRLDRLETLMSMLLLEDDITNVRTDQEDVQKHLLRRLQAMEEKVELYMTGEKEGVHPLGARISQIENLLTEHFKDFKPPVERDLIKERKVHRDCKAALEDGWRTSGVYTIHPEGATEMDVYCDQFLDGGGWIVFQRRLDGSEDFYRNWADYKAGFGDFSGEFWLGNDNLNQLTRGHDHQLKIELHISGREYAYADYTGFFVDDETQNYKVHVHGFSGATPPGDSFTIHDEFNFSTKDHDNDLSPESCAHLYYGGWWYGACHASNLNGLYGNTTYGKGLTWRSWEGYYSSMSSTKMMIRRKN